MAAEAVLLMVKTRDGVRLGVSQELRHDGRTPEFCPSRIGDESLRDHCVSCGVPCNTAHQPL